MLRVPIPQNRRDCGTRVGPRPSTAGSVARLVLPAADDLGVVTAGVRSRLQDAVRRIHFETYDSDMPEVTGSSRQRQPKIKTSPGLIAALT